MFTTGLLGVGKWFLFVLSLLVIAPERLSMWRMRMTMREPEGKGRPREKLPKGTLKGKRMWRKKWKMPAAEKSIFCLLMFTRRVFKIMQFREWMKDGSSSVWCGALEFKQSFNHCWLWKGECRLVQVLWLKFDLNQISKVKNVRGGTWNQKEIFRQSERSDLQFKKIRITHFLDSEVRFIRTLSCLILIIFKAERSDL